MADQKEELRIKKRLVALKRGGVHRVKDQEPMPTAVHLIGIGKTGAEFIAQIMRQSSDNFLQDSRKRFTALAVDIGDQDLLQVQELAKNLPSDRAQVRTLALEVPSRDELFGSLRQYREYLKLEYPRYYWNPDYEPWLPENVEIPQAGEHFPRAIAKAIYGKAYYEEPRVLEQELEDFAKSVSATKCQSVVCVVFGLGGGTGSGIVVDLARHLSNVKFGRRALVLGIGIAPCDGDLEDHRGGNLFPVLNELDCMLDQEKNEGVVKVAGDLYRNPFTAGFLMVPQKPIWQNTKDLTATHQRVDSELALFLTRNHGIDLYETLRLLNWVGAPPSQHMAARSQYGERWVHIFGFMSLDSGNQVPAVDDLPSQLGLIEGSFKPDFFELRISAPKDTSFGEKLEQLAAQMSKVFLPIVEPEVIQSIGSDEASVQFILPGARRTDLDFFYQSRQTYDHQTSDEKLLQHSWLLELGVMLSEPASQFEGMTGECLWGTAYRLAVPYAAIRGEDLAGLKEQLEQVLKA